MDFTPESSARGRVLLDGSFVSVPATQLQSFATLLSHLELVALRSRRVLASVMVDDQPLQLGEADEWSGQWQEIKATSISFGVLSRRLIASAIANLHSLRTGVDKAVLRVMINEPRDFERSWRRWHPDLRNTLAVFNLLRQLWQTERFDQWIEPVRSEQLCEVFDQIGCDLQLTFMHPPKSDADEASLKFSELLEHRLLPALDETHDLLQQLLENIPDE